MNYRWFQFNKIIRDKLVDRLYRSDAKVEKVDLNGEEFITQLKNKLLEEAKEVARATSAEHIKEELADVMEVMISIAHQNGFDMSTIETVRANKYEKRGGFTKPILIKTVGLPNEHYLVEYCLHDPEQYPEIKK